MEDRNGSELLPFSGISYKTKAFSQQGKCREASSYTQGPRKDPLPEGEE